MFDMKENILKNYSDVLWSTIYLGRKVCSV